MAEIRSKRSFWLIAFAAAIKAFIGYGAAAFLAPFFFRNHSAELTLIAQDFGLGLTGFLGITLGIVRQAGFNRQNGRNQAFNHAGNMVGAALSGFVGSLLLRDYDVLVAFTEYNRNVIRLEPPLICQREHVDRFIEAFDSLLSRGIVAIVKDFVKSQVR